MTPEATKVSFCITCMGRLHHLRETLPRNLEWHRDIPGVEFVLLDYSSPDGLAEWTRENLGEVMASGRLVYYQAHGHTRFVMAHAKNVAHRLARGEIVCNLDSDNFAGPGFASYVSRRFAGRERIVLRSQISKGGVHGRIALLKRDFEALGGYDERMNAGWGFDDQDLIDRALRAGFGEVFISAAKGYLKAIQHDMEDRTRFSLVKDRFQSDEMHRQLASESVRTGRTVANEGQQWGSAVVVRNFQDEFRI